MIGRSRWSEVAGIPACLALVVALAIVRWSLPVGSGVVKRSVDEGSAVILELAADGRLTRDGVSFELGTLPAIRRDGTGIVLRIAADCSGAVAGPVLERLRASGVDEIRIEEARE